MDVSLRKITAADAKGISMLSGQLGYVLTVADTEDCIRQMLERDDHIAFAAIDGEQIVGWIHSYKSVLLESKPFMEIGGLVVHELYRSKGIGKKLVQSVKEWCLEKKVHDLRVRSNIKRSEAHKFYLAQGFTEEKQQKVFQIDL
jgi:GNAT superfamily N-acetyltransferase